MSFEARYEWSEEISWGDRLVERRNYERHSLDVTHPLRATIIMSGDSLLASSAHTTIELEGKPINISTGGVCLTLDYDATWEMLSSSKELLIHLHNGTEHIETRGRVTHVGGDRSILGIQFFRPLKNLSPLVQTDLPH